MLLELEWRTIEHNYRACGLRSIPAAQLKAARSRLAAVGIEVEPLRGMSVRPNYSSSLEPCDDSSPNSYWSAIGRRDDLTRLCASYRENDQEVVGRLLGYPCCCIEFFQEAWVSDGMVDTTWPMAARTSGATVHSVRHISIDGPSVCGMQLRWLGVRSVFHLPCSFDCRESVRVAKAHMYLARRLGFAEEVGWLEEMLSWPVEWSALHGIAEIRTPVVKIVTRTDATPAKYVVDYRGDPGSYPEVGATGLNFPYRAPGTERLSNSRAFQLGLDNPIQEVLPSDTLLNAPWYATDNGFTTRYAMDRSHLPMVERVRILLGGPLADCSRLKVLDLGCGNGALLRKISSLHPAVVPVGLDLDPEKIGHARQLFGIRAADFLVSDLFSPRAFGDEGERFFLVILMLGRLVEVPLERAAEFLIRLRNCSEHVLVYAYEDYVRQSGALSAMAARVGIFLRHQEATANVSTAWLAWDDEDRAEEE
jgi:SAM-dependent methyltransferase